MWFFYGLQFIPCDSKKKLKFRFTTRLFCCSVCMHAKSLQSSSTLCDLWIVPARLLCPWGSPDKNAWVSCHALLQGIFLTQGSNPCSCGSCIAGRFFATDPLGKSLLFSYWPLSAASPSLQGNRIQRSYSYHVFFTTNFITQKIH